MTQCTRFPVLVHILVALAVVKKSGHSENLLNSSALAKSVDTNPAVIRRLLSTLVGAGWVQTHAGAHGGAELVVDAASITLGDVYALSDQDINLALHSPQLCCPVANTVKGWIKSVFCRAEAAMSEVLSATTIADIAIDAGPDFEKWSAKRR